VPGRDLVDLRIRNTENVEDKVVGISLRRRDQLKPDVVWAVLAKFIQSNARFGRVTVLKRICTMWVIPADTAKRLKKRMGANWM